MDYSMPTPTPGTTPRSTLNNVGVPPPTTVAAPVPPPAAPMAASPAIATRAAGQRQAIMSSLDPGGRQGLANYGGMTGAVADTVHKLDGFQV